MVCIVAAGREWAHCSSVGQRHATRCNGKARGNTLLMGWAVKARGKVRVVGTCWLGIGRYGAFD